VKRSVYLFCALILLLTMSACGNQPLQNSSQIQSSTADQPLQSSSAVSSQENSVSSDAAVPSKAPVSSAAGSSAAFDPSPQTEQEAWKQVKAALNTKVPLMLPTGLPIGEGHCLTATTVSGAQDYKVNLYGAKQSTAINSKAASQGTFLATVEGTEYPDASSAKNSISAYEKVDVSGADQILDLGYNIKAVESVGLGHQQLIWNEGRWCLWVDSPSDPAYKNKEYPDRSRLAKDVVAYLEDYMLPAPQEIGVIYIGDWDANRFDNDTTVKLQKNQTVYQITCKDPMAALKVAVAMKLQ
jgi:hypothetical protein